MRGLPAHCAQCGNLFEVKNLFGGAGSARIVMRGNRTNCPRCGSMANIADGEFHYSNEQIEFVAGSRWTAQQVTRLQEIYREASQAEAVSPALVDAIAAVSPELGAMAKTMAGSPGGLFALLVLLLFLLSRCSVNVNVDLDVNELIGRDQPTSEASQPTLHYVHNTQEQQRQRDG